MARRCVLGVVLVVALAAWAQPAELVVAHERGWRQSGGALSVRVGGGAWQMVQPGASLGPLALDAGATVIEVKPPGGGSPVKRLAVLEPAARYRLGGNPCAVWELVTESKGVEPTTLTLDLRGVPAQLFPLRVSTARGEGDDAFVVDAPSVTEPVTPALSAMCLHSGFPLRVTSGTKAVLFDAELILEPGGDWGARLTLDKKGKGVASFSRSATP